MIVFDDENVEGFPFLEFEEIWEGLFGPYLFEYSFEAVFIADIEEATIALLVIEECKSGPGKNEAFQGYVLLVEFL